MKHPAATVLLAILLMPLSAHAQPWSIETVQPYGAYFDLALDAAGNPHIVFSNCQAWEDCDPIVPGQAELTYGKKIGGTWTFEDLHHEVLLRYRASPSLVLDAVGEPHIAYIERDHIRYAFRDGNTWTNEQVIVSYTDNWSARSPIDAPGGRIETCRGVIPFPSLARMRLSPFLRCWQNR